MDAGEVPEVRVASTGLIAAAGTSTIELRDPSGTLAASASPTGGPFDVLLTGASSTTAGQWSLTISDTDHHYRIDKLSGSDRGIYVTWLSFAFGAIDVDLIDSVGSPFLGSVGLDIERLGPGTSGPVFSGTFPGGLPLLKPGFYRVTVTPPAGFTATPTSVDIVVGCKATTQVQFRLDALPLLTVHKVVVNDDGGAATSSDFTLTVNGNPEPFGAPTVLSTSTIAESGPFGYDGTISGDCAADGTITLALGYDKTCVITNDDIAPTITLVKQVINDNGGTATTTDFTLTLDGNAVLSGTSTQVTARQAIVIDETTGAGYAFVSITGTSVPGGISCPAVLGGTVFLHEGDQITCTIVNDDIAPPPTGGETTRTQGFWSTHFEAARATWLAVPNDSRKVLGSKDRTTPPMVLKKVMGGFWSDVAKVSTGKGKAAKRLSLDQARMKLVQQYLATVLNVQAFGTDDGGVIAPGKAAYEGSDRGAMIDAAAALTAFNEGGDGAPLPAGFDQGSADPKRFQRAADLAFWDVLP